MRALAQLKFGLIQRGELISELDAAERQVKELLDRIRHEMSDAESRRKEAADALHKAEAARRERASAYDAAAGALRAREDEIAPSVTSDPAWIALKACDAASSTAGEAEKKAAQTEAGREQKPRPRSAPRGEWRWRADDRIACRVRPSIPPLLPMIDSRPRMSQLRDPFVDCRCRGCDCEAEHSDVIVAERHNSRTIDT